MVTSELLSGAALAAGGALVVTGAAKVRAPRAAAAAMTAVGVPGGAAAARSLGVAEIGSGLAAAVAPGAITLGAAAALYAAFALFLLATLRADVSLSSCGCLGDRPLAPNRVHLAIDVAAAGILAVAAAGRTPPSLAAIARTGVLHGVPLLLSAAALVHVSYLAVAHLPQAMLAYRRGAGADVGAARSPAARPFTIRGAAR